MFDTKKSEDEFRETLDAWMKEIAASGPSSFQKLDEMKTLDDWLDPRGTGDQFWKDIYRWAYHNNPPFHYGVRSAQRYGMGEINMLRLVIAFLIRQNLDVKDMNVSLMEKANNPIYIFGDQPLPSSNP